MYNASQLSSSREMEQLELVGGVDSGAAPPLDLMLQAIAFCVSFNLCCQTFVTVVVHH